MKLSETLKEYAATLHFGIIKEIDEEKRMVKVFLEELDMLTHWLHLPEDATQDDKSYGTIDKEAQVALLLNSRGDEGVILRCLYSEEDTPPVTSGDKWGRKFKDGTIIEYDRSEHKLKVDAHGEITIKATGPVTVEGQNVTIKGTLVKVDAQTCEINAPLTKVNNLLVQGKIAFPPLP